MPMTVTHEPKLTRAKRIPEWTVYDDEIAALAARVAASQTEPDGAVEAESDSAIGAFAKSADQLEQAEQQVIERQEFAAAEDKVEVEKAAEANDEDRVARDEL